MPGAAHYVARLSEAMSIKWNNRVYAKRRLGLDVIALSYGEAYLYPDDSPRTSAIRCPHSGGPGRSPPLATATSRAQPHLAGLRDRDQRAFGIGGRRSPRAPFFCQSATARAATSQHLPACHSLLIRLQ
jgi:hypothetical protein